MKTRLNKVLVTRPEHLTRKQWSKLLKSLLIPCRTKSAWEQNANGDWIDYGKETV